MEKITVIVSVYNTERYLSKCLDTIAGQTYQNLEVIIVNDGSTDHSQEICQRYVEADKRFRLINKSNKGVSSARNEGIRAATGEYLAFVDSDDFLAPDIYRILVGHMRQDSVDMLVCSFYYDYGVKNKADISRAPYGIFDQKNYFYQIHSDPFSFYYGVVWNKLFRTQIVIQYEIFFNENISYMEDWNFLMKYLRYAKRIIKIPDRLYYYNRANSASVTQSNDDFEVSYSNRIRAFRDMCEFTDSIDRYTINRDIINAYLLRYIINQKYKIIFSSNKRKARNIHKMIADRREVRVAISSMGKANKAVKIIQYNLKYMTEAFFEYIRRLRQSYR